MRDNVSTTEFADNGDPDPSGRYCSRCERRVADSWFNDDAGYCETCADETGYYEP